MKDRKKDIQDVFLSSTHRDFARYRAGVTEALAGVHATVLEPSDWRMGYMPIMDLSISWR